MGQGKLEDLSKLIRRRLRVFGRRIADVIAFEPGRSERKLEHREIEALLESIGDAILFYDADGNVVRANPTCVEMLGFDPRGASRAEVASRIALRHPGGRLLQAEEAPSIRAVREARRVQLQVEMTNARGQELLLTGSASPVLVDGKARGSVVVWHDSTERERLSAQLDEQRRRLDAVFREVPIGIVILTGEELRIQVANRAYLEFVAEPFRTRGIEGRRFEDIMRRAHESGVLEILRQAQASGRPYVNREYRFEHEDRGTTWWRWVVMPISPDGPVADLAVVAIDITDGVRRRNELEEQRSRLDAILRTMPVGIIVADSTGRIVEANDNACKIWGGDLPRVGLEEFHRYQGRWADTGRPLGSDDWAMARALRKGEVSVGELIDIQRFDGSHGTILNSAAPVTGAGGEPAGAVVVLLDVTEQRRASLALERQTAELAAIVDAVADGMIVYDREGRLLRINAVARDMLGYSAADTALAFEQRIALLRVTRADGKLVPPEETPPSRSLRGEIVRGEMERVCSADGRWRWIAISSAPIRLASGELIGAVATFVDVTQLHDVREEMEDFVRMLSHDIRTPLSTVSMQAQLLLRVARVDEGTRRRAQTIINAASQMDAMIRDLVDTARLETGRYKVQCRPLDLRAFLADLELRLAGVLDTTRIRLAIPEQLPLILADPERLDRILVNLLSNALKYSPSPKEVFLIAQQVSDGVAISVRDQGQGIAPEELPHVFERYFRAKRASRSQVEGLGLGLYITRLLVQAHGGRISVQSELETGSTFTVTLRTDQEPRSDRQA